MISNTRFILLTVKEKESLGPHHKRRKVYELNKCMLLCYSLRSPEDKIKWIFNVFDR